MNRFRFIATLAMVILFSNSGLVKAEGLTLRFEKATTEETKQIRKAIIDSGRFQALVRKLNKRLRLPENVLVRFDDGDQETPYYDPDEGAIVMEYGVFAETSELLADEGMSTNKRFETILHIGEFFFYHELGHALIDVLDLPVLGKEEDAADGLAAFMLLEMTDEPEVALAAARQFHLESEVYDQFEEDSFYDEHSLDRQRYYNIVAWVYGSDPDLHEDAVDELVPEDWWEERAEVAIEEYEFLVESWDKLLGPNLRKSYWTTINLRVLCKSRAVAQSPASLIV